MQVKFYLYCNSKASSIEGQQGWVGKYPKDNRAAALKKEKHGYKVHTTPEYAFALEFNTQDEAESFIKKYRLCCLLMERRDLDY